jgi:iron complex outermembrane recepter protein
MKNVAGEGFVRKSRMKKATWIGVFLGAVVVGVDAGPARAGEVSAPPVTGSVRAADGTPLPHAQVSVVGTGRGTLTDREGRFTLRDLPPGSHRVEVSLVGYRAERRDVEVPTSGPAVRLEVTLTPTPLSIPGVQVTATPGGRDAMGVAQATTQLSGRQLERSMGSTVAQTLQTQPGIGVRYNGPATAVPVMRGLTGDRILILQDGQRVADLSGSADDHSVTVDPLTAQRIEVVRGPASLLYGTNALGGVVNVISGDVATQVPPHAQWSASLQSESAFPGGGGSVRGLVPIGERWALTLRAGGRSTGDARIGGGSALGDRLENTFHRNASGTVALGYAGSRIAGGVSVQGYALEHGVPLPPEEDDRIVLRGRKATAAGHLEMRLDGRFPSVRMQASATGYAHDEWEDDDLEMAFGLRTQTADVLLRQGAFGPLTEGAWGASGLFRQYTATGEEQLTAPADSRSLGVFTFQELPLGGGAALQVGGRLDRYAISSRDDPEFGPGVDRRFTALSGSAGVTVPLAAGVSGALSAARSFRAPTVEELFSDALHIGTASYEIGEANLAPEFSQGLDAMLRVAGARMSAEMSTYGNVIQNFVFLEERGDTTIDGTEWPVLAYVQDRARFLGAEGRVEWMATPRWLVGVQGDVVRAELRDGSVVPFLPSARAGASLRWDDGARTAGAGVRHAFAQHRVALEDEVATDAYTLLDLDLGLRAVRGGRIHSVSLRADNLMNVLYRDAASRIKEFAPNPGRNVSLLYRVWF